MKNKSKHLLETMQYCTDIKTGKIPAGRYCIKAVKRFLTDMKRIKDEDFPYEFMWELADEVIEFAQSLFIPDMNRKLVLLPWQKFIYFNIYGWVHKSDRSRRRFRSGYVEVARKNSKTTSLLFPIILYDFLTTDSAESYFVSQDEKQSYKSFQELKAVVKADKELDKITSDTISAIMYGTNRIAFFSSESKGIDSYKNSCAVIDEFHGYDNDKIVTAFKYGGRARKNNLTLIITSAGLNIAGPCYAENEKARKILNGVLTDDSYFTIIYAYDDKDDWKNKELFIKANPSLGIILKEEILENDLKDALITPSHQADFKAKTCGIWTNDTTNWIPLQKWDTDKRNKIIDVREFEGCICYCGLDLSSISDFTAYSKCFKKEGIYYLFHKFYVPLEQIQEKYRIENINIQQWVEEGKVTAIPGNTIDYDFILTDIIKDSEIFNIIDIAYDKWQSNKLIDSLEEKIPKTNLIEYEQSLRKMTNSTKEFERLIMEDKIIDANPVMKWMVGNAVVKPDANNNYKPVKSYKSSTARIDGVISSIMAIDRCNSNSGILPATTDFNDILKLF